MKKVVKIILAVILSYFVILISIRIILYFNNLNETKNGESNNIEMIYQYVDMIKETLPQNIDEITSLKNVEFIRDKNTIIYTYEIKNLTKSNEELIINQKDLMKDNTLKTVKDNKTNKDVFYKNKIILEFIYLNDKGENLMSFNFYPEDYN